RRHALTLLPDGPSKTRAMLLASVTKDLMLESRYEEAVDAGEEAIAAARAVGYELAELRAMDGRGFALFGLGRHAQGGAGLREALVRMHERGVIPPLYPAVNLAEALATAGRLGEARALIEEGDSLAAEKGAPRRWLMMLRSELAFLAGDWDEAEAVLPA